MIRRQLLSGLLMTLAMTVLVGLAYPLFMTGVAQVAFTSKANGSLVEEDGRAVGSALLGQRFDGPRYFRPRPSAAGQEGYDPLASGGSNLGPTSDKLLTAVSQRAAAYRQANGLAADVPVPVDAVTASASGLDPHISVDNARLQAGRVAAARGLPVDRVLALVDAHTDGRVLGLLGEPGVNVLELDLALDEGGS